MCGIVGYVGPQESVPILLEGLRRLEYRGYDSAGVAILNGEGIKAALENMKDFVPFGTEGMCPAVTWTNKDHRSVDTVGLMRARISGETEQGDYADLMAKAEAIVQAHVAAQPALMAIPAAERQAAHASH